MKIIITENQKEKVLKHLIKTDGWKTAETLVGGPEVLVKLFNNNPMEFLNMYNDLDVVQSEEKPNWTLFRYKKHENLMIHNRKNDLVYIDYYEIWTVLQNNFGLKYTEIQSLTKTWLGEVYNLRGITTLEQL